MNKRNCPNCGAVYEINKNKCPYCDTSYFDLSSLNFTDQKPFYLKVRMNIGGQNIYITQLVRPILENMQVTTNYCYALDSYNKPIATFKNDSCLNTNIKFEAIPDENNNLFTMVIDNEYINI